MIYEIYARSGIPIAVEFDGPIEGLVELIGVSHFLYGKNRSGKTEVIFVHGGENVGHVCQAEDDWENYIVLESQKGKV